MLEVRLLNGKSSYSRRNRLSNNWSKASSHIRLFLRPNRRQVPSRRPPPQRACQKLRRLDHAGKADSRLDAETLQHVEEVLRREVAGRARGVRAAAEAPGGGVERRDAALEPRVDVGEPGPARVVEVQGEDRARHARVVEGLDDLEDAA